MGKIINLTGQRFGRWTVIKKNENHKNGSTQWYCQCACGRVKSVASTSLINNKSKSCGCYRSELLSKKMIKHGHAKRNNKHPLYLMWKGMKTRCYNPKADNYDRYGKRGIIISPEWINSPEKFISWCLKNGWKEKLQIDRIDNNNGYSPDNCRMTTPTVNNLNQRIRKDNTTGYRGVCLRNGKYTSRYYYKRKTYWLGVFKEAKVAAISRDWKAILTGSAYFLNFPELRKAVK